MDIVYIHGSSDTQASFAGLVKYFPNVKLFDLPGFGVEDKPEIVYDKKLFLTYLRKKITKKSVLIGFSMGGFLAKDFALAYPHLVEKIIVIAYPLQKSRQALKKALQIKWLNRQYANKTLMGKILCHNHWVYRWFVILFVNLFMRPYRFAIRGWFAHTYQSILSATQDYILKSDPMELTKIKARTVIIVGERDVLVDKALLSKFRSHVIPGMGHTVFGYEEQVARIIKNSL